MESFGKIGCINKIQSDSKSQTNRDDLKEISNISVQALHKVEQEYGRTDCLLLKIGKNRISVFSAFN